MVRAVHENRNREVVQSYQSGGNQRFGGSMKIKAVRAHALSAPLSEPLWTAQEALKDSSLILVEVETDDGLVGYGEIKGSPIKTIVEWVVRFGELIKGADPLAHEIIWNRLFMLTVPRP